MLYALLAIVLATAWIGVCWATKDEWLDELETLEQDD